MGVGDNAQFSDDNNIGDMLNMSTNEPPLPQQQQQPPLITNIKPRYTQKVLESIKKSTPGVLPKTIKGQVQLSDAYYNAVR